MKKKSKLINEALSKINYLVKLANVKIKSEFNTCNNLFDY